MALHEQILRLQGLFRGNSRVIGQASPDLVPEKDGKLNQSVRGFAAGPATEDHWQAHLLGTKSLGIVPITDYQEVKFMAIDVDLDIMDHLKVTLESLAAQVEAHKMPFVVCRSKSGAAHLYVFFTDNTDVVNVRRTLLNMTVYLGMSNSGRPVETFPHTSHLEPESNGKYINLPYFNMGSERYAINSRGDRLDLDQFISYAESKMLKGSEFCKWKAPANEDQSLRDVVCNGPPCLQTIYDQGLQDGTKNDILFQFGILFKKYNPKTFRDNVEIINNTRCDTPHDTQDLSNSLKGLGKKDYRYNCAHPCMSPICAKALCMSRKYGITAKVEFPAVKELIQWGESDEYFEMVFESGQKLKILAKDLLRFETVQEYIIQALHLVLPIPKKQDWSEFVLGLMSKVRRVQVDQAFTVEHSIRTLIVSYATSRAIGTKLEDLLVRKPVKEGDNILIRHKDLQEEILKRRFPAYVEGLEYAVVMNDLKGHFTVKEIGDQKWPCFVIPDPKINQKEIIEKVATDYEPKY